MQLGIKNAPPEMAGLRTASTVRSVLYIGHSFSADPATAQQCAASTSAHRLTTIIHKLCVTLLHCHSSANITFCVTLEVRQWVAFLATKAQSPENPSA